MLGQYERGLKECHACRAWLPATEFRVLRINCHPRRRSAVCELCECMEHERRIRRRRARLAEESRRREVWHREALAAVGGD